jgi:hypothetical protein
MTVVYTALLGGSDTLKPAPIGLADRCVCFTDAPAQDPKNWMLVPWSVIEDPRRDAWRLRCRPDLLFPTADRVLWLDASFEMLDVAALFRDAGDAELAGLHHHERSSCYAEGEELIAIGQSDEWPVRNQLTIYDELGFVPSGLTTAGILLRRRTPRVLAFNRLWEAEIARHPGDNTQLSLDYAAWIVGLPIVHLQGTYPDNPYVFYNGEDHHAHRRPYR